MSRNASSMRERASFYNDNKLKLGLFGMNCSSGRAVTMVPERWSGSWEDNLRAAQIADDAGIDFLLPLGRWKGYGGDTDFEGETFETITWATGLLGKTKQITAFATVHVPLIHPIVAAKQMVTADHASEGRFGLNIVCGWNEGEFEMFGVTQRDHEMRYEYAQEWIDAVRKMWTHESEFGFEGQFIKLGKVRADPKPYGGTRPMIMNAGASATGQAFAIRNCDALFTSIGRFTWEQMVEHVGKVKTAATAGGRDVEIYTIGIVTCRPTMKEAQDYYQHWMFDNADWKAIENIMRMQGVKLDEMSPAEQQAARHKGAVGLGGYTINGDPDFVAGELAKISGLGIRGIGISLVNYADELPFIIQEVLPRLEKMGLRVKVQG